MFIQTEATPNPATLKFLPGRAVLEAGTLDMPSKEAAAQSPLAERLFDIPNVGGVFFGSDFISVTKSDGEWPQIKPAILGETRVRPAVAGDGGDITFKGYKEGVVFLQMKGACSGCPSSTATLQHGIQNLLKHFVPEVVEIRPV